jgi:uncharacterized membrane protein YuzA (DUF378 family)
MFGIGGLVIAGTIIVSIIIGFITFNVIVPIAQSIPPLGYAIIGIVSLPAILALFHTIMEMPPARESENKKYMDNTDKKYPKFSVKIEKTVYDWSYVYLKAGSIGEIIAFESHVDNDKVQSVAINLLNNAESIYDKHVSKVSGVFTKPLPVAKPPDNESLLREIDNLKQKVDELSKNKRFNTKPMSELERQNKENNSTIET